MWNETQKLLMSTTIPPIHTLPFELLADIFRKVIRDCVVFKPRRPDGRWETDAIVLCEVCVYWREVAQRVPALWSVQPLPLEDAGFTKLFLTRSEPLSVQISAKDLCELPLALVQAQARWGSLYVTATSPQRAKQLFARLSPAKYDNLRVVRFDLDKNIIDWTVDQPQWDFEHAPKLILFGFRAPLTIQLRLPAAPFAQLKELILTMGSPQDCFDAFALCTSATDIRIHTCQWQEPVRGDFGVATKHYRNLRRLTLTIDMDNTAGENVGPFLRLVRQAPQLEDVALKLEFPDSADDVTLPDIIPSLEAFLTGAPKLWYLDLNGVVDSNELALILAKTPALTHLGFSNPATCATDAFFDSLSAQKVAPNLTSIHLHNIGEDFCTESFETFVRSRWWLAPRREPKILNGVSRLEALQLHSDWEPEFDALVLEMKRLFRILRQEGLNISYWIKHEMADLRFDDDHVWMMGMYA